MIERRKPIPIKEAITKVMDYIITGETEYISIVESYGRHLSEDLKATHDVPHFDRSPYDGFAVRALDTELARQNNPIEFEVIDHIGAGTVTNKKVQAFQAVRIMTGAQMPEGSDTVVMLELAKSFDRNGKSFIAVKRPFKTGENVSYRGEDAKKGEVLVTKGTKINPGIQAILATFGYAKVPVAKKPKVGLFATGTELLDVNDELVPGKIRNSNSYMISGQIERAGADVIYFGQLPDDFEMCFDAIKNALHKVDMLVTTGGVSVGDYDYLPGIYQKLGAEVLFNKVAMRPGSVTTVAQKDGKLLFGLSGNPSACYVGFELFTRPIIQTMLFSKKPHLRKEKALLGIDFPKVNPFTRLVRSNVTVSDGRLMVSPSGVDKSNIVMSLAGANALMILPGGTRGFSKGMEVDVFMLEDHTGSEWPW
ncbi:molybdopterin molybdotransferase MoeA [Bacillus aquiflavi]|uniref:Molybdopterin molybdenumtransferase n=1 Tax=Bacillus aquiflavi TaxID=2672567 RepID=A0A6B3VSA6_9BACI|nr:gephyrin-like molybdotransferase Glp [Bacillus aquiflavi]MBA4536481.1 molybdopterin molybdotransferase MoeA [Bacillus aquiflavi]NEY80849.1 molybdopterin molybdotransferase MoeA [Bacillus aquiflavi]UAC49959.1 molybdopterin molybdotransferase MoeA [Bacillus aquiflavi]